MLPAALRTYAPCGETPVLKYRYWEHVSMISAITPMGQRFYLTQLPSYSPDLNPDEGVWNYLKRVELKNVCCHDLPELRTELRKAVARLRHKKDIIQSFVRQVYPDLFL